MLKDGEVTYAGNWRSGKKLGYCCYTISKGHTYEGTMEFEMRHGYGRLTNKSEKETYVGEY
jgi:hypothetical protein